MQIRDYDPTKGCAFQGDIAIIPIPNGIAIATTDELAPIDGRLIIREGEATGHHHAIEMPSRRFRPDTRSVGDPVQTRNPRLQKAFGGRGKPAVGIARMYRDPAVAQKMQRRGILTRTDLAIAALVVEGGPVVVSHEEHDGIRLPAGRYLLSRQVESISEQEKLVQD